MNILFHQKVKLFLKSSPFIYYNFIVNKKHISDIKCSKNTDIVIEGYPRSANTYFIDLINTSYDIKHKSRPKIAHHLHSISQLKMGVKYKIPTIILIRTPMDAISSYIIRNDKKLNDAIIEYIHFYKYVNKKQNNLLIIDFVDITTNHKEVIDKINNHYKLNIPNINPKTLNDIIFEKIKNRDKQKFGKDSTKFAIPSDEKKELKKLILKQIVSNKNYKAALEIYNQIIDTN